MTIPVLICDDSSLARKQVARALPSDWPVTINFAGSGEEALAAVRAGQGDVLFLDLNMPGLDGYQVLETIRAQDLPTLVIVIFAFPMNGCYLPPFLAQKNGPTSISRDISNRFPGTKR